MKNIHLIPTDKEQHSIIQKHTGLLLKQTKQKHFSGNKFNLFITSDEEIKEGDWFYDLDTKYIKIKQSWENSHLMFNSKKIILTTDGDLIKDGVQAIDDEFLEWFVKNPSCEYVEVKRNKKLSNKSIWDAVEGDLVFNNHNCGGVITQLSNDIRVHIISENGEGYVETATTSDNGLDTLVINNYKVCEYSDYKIIIPKEKPKQEMRKVCKCKRAYENPLSEICSLCWNELYPNEKDEIKDEDLLEPKQETLEEAAERIFGNNFNGMYHDDIDSKMIIMYAIDVAKWQQEQDNNKYSEEEMLLAFETGRNFQLTGENNFKELIEQLKK